MSRNFGRDHEKKSIVLEEVKSALSARIPPDIVGAILQYHTSIKNCLRLEDWERCLLHGGKFAEEVMKVLHYVRTKRLVDSISIDSEAKELEKCTQLPDPVRILIPRALRVVYDHRNKRGGAHASFDPNAMDSALVASLCDWILGELVRVYCTQNPEMALKFVTAVTTKSVPLVEHIDGDFIVLKEKTSAREEIGWILYERYPERTTTEQLKNWMPDHSANNISVTLRNMRKKKLVHYNSAGFVLTTLGIKTTEDELALLDKRCP